MKSTAAVIVLALCILQSRPVRACGVSASGAPAGICDASDVLDEKASAARNRVGVSYGYTSSVLFFTDNLRAPTERHAVMASFEHPFRMGNPAKPGSKWTFEAGAGSLLGGYLLTPSGKATFSPGVLAGVSLSHLIIEPRGAYASPFLLLSFALAGVWSRTEIATAPTAADYVAFDFSFSAAAGMSIRPTIASHHSITPFIAGRLFGGPVFWTHNNQNTLGTDAYKYALGPGFAVSIERSRVGLSFGCSVVGEKNLRGGVSVAF